MRDYFKRKEVLIKINQGDKNTFLQMYDFYAPKLFRHAYYRIGAKEVAEDIAQQVFYKTWQYLMGPENKIDNLNAFLYRITNNLITDYYRKKERKNITLNDKLENKLLIEPSYTKEVDHNLEIDRLKQALGQLNSDQRNLITWRYFDDLSVAEIAEISGKSKNAVYVSIHRALKQVQQITVKRYENT